MRNNIGSVQKYLPNKKNCSCFRHLPTRGTVFSVEGAGGVPGEGPASQVWASLGGGKTLREENGRKELKLLSRKCCT